MSINQGFSPSNTLQAGAAAAVTLNAPQVPVGSDGTNLQLTWSQSADATFQSYKLYRSTTPGVTEASTLLSTVTSQPSTTYTDTGLAPNATFYYKVYVVNAALQSTGSNEVNGVPQWDGPPEVVTLNAPANVTGTSVDLSWTQSAAADFAAYKVYRATLPTVTTRDTLVFTGVQVSGVTCQDTGLSRDTTYYYKVFVYDQAAQQGIRPENVSPSNEVSAYTPAQTAEPPTVSALSVGGQAVVAGAVMNPVNARSFIVTAQYARGATTSARVKTLELWLDANTFASAMATSEPKASGQRNLNYSDDMGSGLSVGNHTLKVRAIDNAGHSTDSAVISFATARPSRRA